MVRPHGQGYEEDPHSVCLHSVVEKEEEQFHEHDHDYDDKKTVLKKVKAKAKKLKDTIKKHGHGHDNDHHVHEELDEDGYEDEDEEMEVDPEVHAAPMYDSAAAESYAPGQGGVVGQNGGGDQNELSYLRSFGPGKEEHVETPKSGYEAEQRAVSAQLRSDLEKPMVLKEDPHAPKGKGQTPEPENYLSKVADPTGEGGQQIGIAPILHSLEKIKIQEESADQKSKPATGQDESLFNPTLARFRSSGMETQDQHLYTGSHDQFSLTEPRPDHEKQEQSHDQYTGSTVMAKMQDSAVEHGGVRPADKGISVTRYLAEKLRPSEEDKALSEVIVGTLRKPREKPNKAVEEEHGGKVRGRVTESEEVAKRLGSSSREKGGEDVGNPKKGVVDKLKGAVTSWFGKAGETQPSQIFVDTKAGNAGPLNSGSRVVEERAE